MSTETEDIGLINRREAIRRVSALLGGVAFVGGTSLLTACEKGAPATDTAKAATAAKFSAEDIAFLDEIADTILPTTAKSPGAKAAKTGAFMALMVTDTYGPAEQKRFHDGMQAVDEASKKANKVGFVQATPEQRIAILTSLDLEAKRVMDGKEAADRKKKGLAPLPPTENAPTGDKFLPDQRKENAPGAPDANPTAAITTDTPTHYFRMMKELACLGYFTSEIGYTKAMRYVESPGKFEPCIPYTKGEPAWAPHA
jgi:hypothetical protein